MYIVPMFNPVVIGAALLEVEGLIMLARAAMLRQQDRDMIEGLLLTQRKLGDVLVGLISPTKSSEYFLADVAKAEGREP